MVNFEKENGIVEPLLTFAGQQGILVESAWHSIIHTRSISVYCAEFTVNITVCLFLAEMFSGFVLQYC